MTDSHQSAAGVGRFFQSLLQGIIRDIFWLIIAFAIGTTAGAIACWYTGLPMVLSLAGGILVLVIVLLFYSESAVL